VSRGQRDRTLRPYSWLSRREPLLFLSDLHRTRSRFFSVRLVARCIWHKFCSQMHLTTVVSLSSIVVLMDFLKLVCFFLCWMACLDCEPPVNKRIISNYFTLHFRYHFSDFLATDPEVRVRFPALPDFLASSGSGTGSTQPREH
jgi:hypothetical protein